jgi:hypothetical protein
MRAIVGPLVIVGLLVVLWMVFVNGNPGGLSDAKYSEFKALPAPRILYSCARKPTPESVLQKTRECAQSGRAGCDEKAFESGEAGVETVVEFVAGGRTSTYDQLLRSARQNCGRNLGTLGGGTLTVLEASKN